MTLGAHVLDHVRRRDHVGCADDQPPGTVRTHERRHRSSWLEDGLGQAFGTTAENCPNLVGRAGPLTGDLCRLVDEVGGAALIAGTVSLGAQVRPFEVGAGEVRRCAQGCMGSGR